MGQSHVWRSPLYLNFVDYGKVFDSLDRNILWDMVSYGISRKIIALVRKTYEGNPRAAAFSMMVV